MIDVKNKLVNSPYGDEIEEIVSYCVSLTSAKLLAQLQTFDASITGVYFQHGHILEVVSELEKLSKAPETKATRYPLVALLRDFPELNGALPGIESQDTLNFIVATRTNPNWNSAKRKTNTFDPILKPIVNDLLYQFELSGKFMSQGADQQNYTAVDRYFWGRESIYGSKANIFNDWIDCIEIKNLTLKIYDYGR
jgi:hypothetical protein